ncbi:erythromycin resistance leader peptide [Lysinibacillus sp. LK3]
MTHAMTLRFPMLNQ